MAADEKSVSEISSPEDPSCCLDKGKRMSLCSEEVCELAEQKKKLIKSDNLSSLTEESNDRPESPVPFNKQESVNGTPKEELKSFELSVQNLNLEQKTDENRMSENLSAESLCLSKQQGSSSSQNVDVIEEEGGIIRTRKTKVEESFSRSSTSYSSVQSSKTVTRCITPEICEIMDKPRGSPCLNQPEMDRPATPQQTVVFPPEIPAFVPLPRSRASTPQPHALQRILSEELGLRPLQPPVPIEEIIKTESIKSSEELFTKSEVDEIVQKEIQKYKTEEKIKPELSDIKHEEVKSDSHTNFNKIESENESLLKLTKSEEQIKDVQSLTVTTQQIQSDKQGHSVQEIELKQTLKDEDQKDKLDDRKSSQESNITTDTQQISCFLKKPDRPFSPVHPPQSVVRPKPQPVPLPPETKPYVPAPPPPEDESQKPQRIPREEACQSPLVFALTVAPKQPYSPLPIPKFKPISLEDLPSPPQGSERISLLSALTIAPDTPYTPFPEPVDVSKQSPPKFDKKLNGNISKQSSIQKSVSTTSSTIDSVKKSVLSAASTPAKAISSSTTPPKTISSSYESSKFISDSKKDSAFKPVVQKPIIQAQTQQHHDITKQPQSVPSQSFPPVSDELKSSFGMKTQVQSQQSSYTQNSSTQSLEQGSPFEARKPDLLPIYQQNIGEIPLPNRSSSPIRPKSPIRAPKISGYQEPKRTVSEQIKRSSFYGASSGYVSSSVFGQKFTASKEEAQTYSSSIGRGGAKDSDNLLPYYQQNIGEIPLAHRPKSPVPHPIKAPSIDGAVSISRPTTPLKPSPLAGKAPETLSKSKQIFKPEIKHQNVFAGPPETPKHLTKTLPHFSYPPAQSDEEQRSNAPWIVKKDNLSSQSIQSVKPLTISTQMKSSNNFLDSVTTSTPSQPKPSTKISDPPSQKPSFPKLPDFKSAAVSSQQSQSTSQTTHKLAAGFTPPSQNKPIGPSTTSDPPAGAGVDSNNKGGSFAGSTAPRRGRGTLNPSVGPGTRVPLCGSCSKQIRGPFITALGQIWCPEHFICANAQCRRPLQDIGFVEENTGLYCEYCFEQFLAPNCNKCGSKIKGDCLNAIGKHFHPECFCCAYCGKLFGNSPFFLEDALPYCENDWNELFTTKCFSCGFPIEAGDRWVEALSNNYHSQCFNCTMCKKNLEGQSFYAKGGRPFCKTHAR